MGVTYRSSATNNTGATPASSLTLAMPSGFQPNDQLIVALAVAGGTGATVTTPTGWTLLSSTTESTDVQLCTYWKLATGYEGSTLWTFDSARQASGAIAAYSGAGSYAPPTIGTGTKTASTSTASIGNVNSTWETGLSIQIFGVQNTSVATTVTATGSFSQRADTCTSATSFVEVVIQDKPKALTLGGITTSAGTISTAANSLGINFFMDDQRPIFSSLATDYYVVGTSSTSNTTRTTANFAVNQPNELLLAFVMIQNGTTTISSITGGGLTWVNVTRSNTKAGSTELWRAFAPTPQTFIGTITFSAATVSDSWMFVGIVGADMTGTNGSGAIGAVATAGSAGVAPTVSLTTTRNNSWVFGAVNDSSASTTPTAGSNQTLLRTVSDGTNLASGWTQRQNTITPTSGTVVTINNTAPSTDTCNILAVEILPAVSHSLGSTGAGG